MIETALAAITSLPAALPMAAAAGALGGGVVLLALRGALRPQRGQVPGHRHAPAPPDVMMAGGLPGPKGTGIDALFRIEGDRLIPETEAAHTLHRKLDLPADRIATTSGLAGAFNETGAAFLTAMIALERRGEGFSVVLRSISGEAWSASGAPRAGDAWLVIAPAAPEHLALREAKTDLERQLHTLTQSLATLDAAPVLIWRRDPEGTLTWANARYCAFAGCEDGAPLRPLQFNGVSPRPEVDPDNTPPPREPMPDGRLALFHAVSGQRRWHEISHVLQADGAVLGFALDAGAAVMAESALRRFVETLTETFAHLRIGLAIFDSSRRLGLFNPAFAEMMHMDPAWLAGRPRLEDMLLRLRESRMMPDRADFSAWRTELLRLFESPDAADYTEDWALPGDVSIRVLARPHPQGSLAFMFEDVTETAKLERRFATEIEIRRAVIERLEEGVAAFGPDGRAQFANPAFARIWGFRPGAPNSPGALAAVIRRCRPLTAGPVGAPGAPPLPDAAHDPDTRQDIWARLAAFAAEGARRTAWSERLRLLDGRVLRARIATLPDGSILTAFSDVTDAERAAAALTERNAALEAADEMRSALVEQTSRHLRTPLNIIGGHAQALQSGGLDISSEDRARAILDRAREVHEAIDEMADLANAQAGSLALHDGDVDLRAAVESVQERATRAAAERGVTLKMEIDDRIHAIPGDDLRLRQILVNLITDAVQRAPVGAIVQAGVRPAETETDGTGPMVEIWTSEPTLDTEPRRGLAHALARRLAELHGGYMRVRAETGKDGPCMQVICALPAGRRSANPSTITTTAQKQPHEPGGPAPERNAG
ncbi:MAG: signal transduction histidine kinase [Paracoccaceae bacterium]|jgi:signal transduction histidine kinase